MEGQSLLLYLFFPTPPTDGVSLPDWPLRTKTWPSRAISQVVYTTWPVFASSRMSVLTSNRSAGCCCFDGQSPSQVWREVCISYYKGILGTELQLTLFIYLFFNFSPLARSVSRVLISWADWPTVTFYSSRSEILNQDAGRRL
uniref:Uncharacterized protein n=1 Tax=Pipistrellus kuhlii TaxID=59472 RepID=A0A7J7XVW4_PIPKU|nr:hypothetical protein mPipKuh1_010446 [Pipistrellus kuhlii]